MRVPAVVPAVASCFVFACGLLAGCAPTPAAPKASIMPNPTVGYACENQIKLLVRLDGPSASVTVDGAGPFTLPQLSSTGDMTVFSDGQRVMQIKAGRVSFGLGRSVPAACISN